MMKLKDYLPNGVTVAIAMVIGQGAAFFTVWLTGNHYQITIDTIGAGITTVLILFLLVRHKRLKLHKRIKEMKDALNKHNRSNLN